MNDKFQNKYRIPTNRLQGYDYGANGLYFVTICSKDKIHYFGEIINPVETDHNLSQNHNRDMHNVNIGNVETHNEETENVGTHNVEMHNVETGNCPSLQYTEIGKIANGFWLDIPNHYPSVILDEFVIMPNHIHGIIRINKENNKEWNPNQFGKQSSNLGAIIRAYKSSVKRYANQNDIAFHWQTRYHDRIIRDDREYYAVKNYIINNLSNWNTDDMF